MEILIVEDDINLNEGLKFVLQSEGYTVISATTANQFLIEFERRDKISLIIMDCNLPDGNGYDLCGKVREVSQVPIIMLTARDLEIDQVRGLKMGVDDYITKPFSVLILKLRINALLKRRSANSMITSNGINLYPIEHKVSKSAEFLDLSKTEYNLLYYLIINRNQILLKDQIIDYLWGADEKYVDDNALSVNIRRLRKKIEDDPSDPKYIKNIYGMGYMWDELF